MLVLFRCLFDLKKGIKTVIVFVGMGSFSVSTLFFFFGGLERKQQQRKYHEKQKKAKVPF